MINSNTTTPDKPVDEKATPVNPTIQPAKQPAEVTPQTAPTKHS